ncbi:glycosyltransferase [Amycolatopsis pigmentata]|uniref:Glycosyltransferase n=1 Tax=Amycolatopsis pigmentata TaxID=450801 RepID=A0ABW5FPD0_9PSEU
MLPVADAARAAGHETAVLTAAEMAPLVAPLPVFPAGPTVEHVIAETIRLTGSDPAQPGPAAVEMFAGIRVELALDESLRQARSFDPDLMVCEAFDYAGPVVASALGVPWAAHGISGPVPDELVRAMGQRVASEYEKRSLVPVPPIGFVDPYPDLLRDPAERTAEDRITLRPTANEHGMGREAPSLPRSERPSALVTVGTTVSDDDELSKMVSSVAAAGFTVIVTAEAEALALSPEVDRRHVHPVGFVPLATLLPSVDVVVTAGGTGTVLAALSRSLPMVIRPFHADQPWNAARAAGAGAAIVVEDATEAGTAAGDLVKDPKYRESAAAVATELASLNSPDEVLRQLISRSGRTVR